MTTAADAVPESPRTKLALSGLFAALAVALLIARAHYGVDLTDEGIYSILPLRFARGALPFLDELSPLQGSGVAMLPFVWLYSKVFGTQGLVLAIRGVYVLCTVVAACASYAFLSRLTARASALVLSFIPVLFLAWGMPSAGYGHLGVAMMSITISLVGYVLAGGETRRSSAMFMAGGCGVTASLCVPPVALVFALAAVWLVRMTRSWRLLCWMGAGALAVAAPALVFFGLGMSGVVHHLQYLALNTGTPEREGGDIYVGGTAKIKAVATQTFAFVDSLKRVWVAVIVAVSSSLSARVFAFVVAGAVAWCAVPILVIAERVEVPTMIASALHMLAVLVYLVAPQVRNNALSFALVAGTLYAVLVSYTSTSGFVTAAQGSLAILPTLLAILVAPSSATGFAPNRWAAWIAVAMVVAASTVAMWTSTWGDGAPAALTSRIEFGAYRGLRTTPERAEWMRALQRDLDTWAKPHDIILAYDEFPGVYLLAQAEPVTTTIWYGNGNSRTASRFLAHVLVTRQLEPTVVIRNKIDRTYPGGHVTDDWIRDHYVPVVSRDAYDLLVCPERCEARISSQRRRGWGRGRRAAEPSAMLPRHLPPAHSGRTDLPARLRLETTSR